MAAWIWVLIPLAAILVGAFKEWLKFKSKQEKLGTSTHELEETVRALERALEKSEAERESVVRRLENLEAIVTSEAWDALHEGESSGPGGLLTENPRAESARAESSRSNGAPPSDADRTARMARRLNS